MWIGFTTPNITVNENQTILDEFEVLLDIQSLRISEVSYPISIDLRPQRSAVVLALSEVTQDSIYDARFGSVKTQETQILEARQIAISGARVTIINDFLPETTESFGLTLTSGDVDRRVFNCYDENEEPVLGAYYCTIEVIIVDNDGKCRTLNAMVLYIYRLYSV